MKRFRMKAKDEEGKDFRETGEFSGLKGEEKSGNEERENAS